jgi:6-pyruvoyl-tetrahydropterin synthase
MRSELILKFQFEASHSLAGYEAPHSHLWKLELVMGGQVIDGKIVDMIEARNQIEKLIDPLRGTYLNENPIVGTAVQKSPTCETLNLYFSERFGEVLEVQFKSENSTLHLASVMVTICSPDGIEMGGVRLFGV